MKRCAPSLAASLALLLSVSWGSPAAALDEADRLWLVGERAFADRLYPAARRALERFVDQFPSDPRQAEAMLLLGKVRLQVGDVNAALEAFRRAQRLSPPPGRSQEARFWEAEALFRLQQFSDARMAYDEVVRQDAASPLAPDAVYGRAWSDLELKRPEAAITGFRELLATWPDHELAASATLQLARALAEQKKTSEAVALLTTFATRYPKSRLLPDARYLLGWAKAVDGDPRGGVAELQAFVKAYPDHPQTPAARRLITQTLTRYGSREEQAEAYKSLMEQQPASADALYGAAQIASRLGRAGDQQAAWKRLNAEFPQHALTRRLALDMAAAEFKKQNYKAALPLAQQAADSEEAAVKSEAWLLVGESELKLKRYAPAARAFDAVGAVPEVDAGVRYRALAGLGLAREEQQEWRAALTAYEAVAARSPDATLREWAKQRASAVKTRAGKSSAPGKPAAKPAPKKSAGGS